MSEEPEDPERGYLRDAMRGPHGTTCDCTQCRQQPSPVEKSAAGSTDDEECGYIPHRTGIYIPKPEPPKTCGNCEHFREAEFTSACGAPLPMIAVEVEGYVYASRPASDCDAWREKGEK